MTNGGKGSCGVKIADGSFQCVRSFLQAGRVVVRDCTIDASHWFWSIVTETLII